MIKKIKDFLFRNTTTRQTVAKNTFWLAVSNFGGRFIRAGVIIYAARVLGAASWGVFSYAITLVAFFTLFGDLGINNILTKEIAKAPSENHRLAILSSSFFIKVALAALGVLLILFIAPHLTKIQEVNTILPIVVFVMIFDSLREFGFAIIHGTERMEQSTAIFLGTNVAIVVLGFIFLRISPTVKSFAIAYALGTGMGAVATVFPLKQYLKKFVSGFSFSTVKRILSASWPFAVSGALGMLLTNTDILIVGWFRTAEDIGLYSAAIRIIQLLYLLPVTVQVSALPTFARLAAGDSQKFRQALERAASFLFLIAIPVALCGAILGKEIMSFVFGEGFVAGAASLQVLMLTMLFNFPAVLISSAVFAYNRQKQLIIYSAIAGVANVILDLVLIPRFGITGSAFATLFAQILSNSYLWYVMKKINYFEIMPHLKKIIAASFAAAAASLALLTLGMHILLITVVVIGIYAAILALLREPVLEEFRLVLNPSAGDREVQ